MIIILFIIILSYECPNSGWLKNGHLMYYYSSVISDSEASAN